MLETILIGIGSLLVGYILGHRRGMRIERCRWMLRFYTSGVTKRDVQ